jgi:hypothetical protein
MLVILQMISQKKQKLQQIHKFHIGIFQIPLQQYEKVRYKINWMDIENKWAVCMLSAVNIPLIHGQNNW